MDERIGLRAADGREIAFRGATLTAHLAGLLAQSEIIQRYENATADTLEITYTFALPVDAVLLGFEVEVGERKLHGEVVPRAQAEVRYEAAIEEGNSAFRLMHLRPGLYGASLGNLMAGETATLRLRYAEPLAQLAGRLRYRIPTTIAPRYGTPHDIPAWMQPQSDLAAQYGFQATIHLEGELARARFACPTHRLGCEAAPGRLTLTLAAARMDRDFVLDLEAQGAGAIALIAATDADAGDWIAMASFMPTPRPRSNAGRQVAIVLDCSGSMAGDSIRHAQEGVRLALSSLSPQDRFGLVRFGSRSQVYRPRLVAADAKEVEAASVWVSAADADLGGTEMAAALRTAMDLAGREPEADLDVLLLTDGEAWNLQAVADEARQKNVRIFTLGIGSAVAEDTVRELADRTGGACELITPDEAMPQRIAAHFDRMRQIAIREVALFWGGVTRWEVRPSRALFAGDAFTVSAALRKPAEGLQATLRYADGSVQELSVALAPAAELTDAVVRCAAATRLPLLPEAERAEWALRHRLVSAHTDYIVVLERAEGERADALPVLQQTPQMMAAGWAGVGTVTTDVAICCEAPMHDVPGVLRSGRRASVDMDEMYSVAEPARATWRTVVLEALRLRLAANADDLPTRIDELVAMGLDVDPAGALRKLVTRATDEAAIVRCSLQVLVKWEHAEGDPLFASLLNDPTASPLPAQTFAAVKLAIQPGRGWRGRVAQLLRGATTHDIPSFLRGRAD
jgi:Ca-activated chloride channel family protein